MSFRIQLAAALFSSVAVIATGRSAYAQSQQTSMVRNGAAAAPQSASVEELPAGQLPAGQMVPGGQPQGYYPEPGDGSNAPPNCCGPGGCGVCGDPCCDQSYCPPACCNEPACDSSGCEFGVGGGQWFFVADVLSVRADFSEATAKVHESLANGTDEFVPLDFNYESSFRIGGGYQLCCCGEQIRFLYTRMTSSAVDHAFPGDLVPIEAPPPPGGETFIHADVDTKSFDLEWAKTWPLGGQCCDCCSTPCDNGCCQTGCGEPCCRCCPSWDITWSGGLRWGDVDWNRSYVARDANGFAVTDARIGMTFSGAGLRTGLEGRRYFFKDGWLSVYAKGDISLLLGDVNIKTTREVNDPTVQNNPVTTNTQTFTSTQIIPVTEIEAGVTGQVTCHSSVTLGYLLAAWHDLGFRDEDTLNTLLPVRYDDANILGFDGFFARWVVTY